MRRLAQRHVTRQEHRQRRDQRVSGTRRVHDVDIEQRMDAALERAALVADALIIINPPPRAAFEAERAATLDNVTNSVAMAAPAE